MLEQFFAITSLLIIIISVISLVLLVKNFSKALFCYIRYKSPMDLSDILIPDINIKVPLSPQEIIRKQILKDKLDRIYSETLNLSKSHKYIMEKQEGYKVNKDEQAEEFSKILEVYKSLNEMDIDNSETLDEVEFLFNNGKLRTDKEIVDFYDKKAFLKKAEKFRKTKFHKTLTSVYLKTGLSSRYLILLWLTMPFVTFFIIKALGYDKWNIIDMLTFIVRSVIISFDYTESYSASLYGGYNHYFLEFTVGVLLLVIPSTLIFMTIYLVTNWLAQKKIYNISKEANVKYEIPWKLGINTATYLYFIHRLSKIRS